MISLTMRTRLLAYFLLALILIALLLLSGLGCAGPQAGSGNTQFVATHIYFGLNKPAGGEVSEDQFNEFLEKVVTPAFPLGLTAYDAYGQMQTSQGQIVKQKTKVLLLVHDNSKANADAIHRIAATYRSEFGNPQVMIMTDPVSPEFYGN